MCVPKFIRERKNAKKREGGKWGKKKRRVSRGKGPYWTTTEPVIQG